MLQGRTVALAKAGGNKTIAAGTQVGAWEGQNQVKLWEMERGRIQVGGIASFATFPNDKMRVSGGQHR